MHLLTDEEIRSMPSEDLQFKLEQSLQPAIEIENTHTMQTNLAKIQRSRTLVCWRDHATILGRGCIMITINALYDTRVYMTEEDYRTKFGRLANNLQSIIERPYIYLLSAGSSSVEDQATLVPDRTECLQDLGQSIVASNGVEIVDTLQFFKGDTPAKQMERGTQIGGHYKCSCGCPSDRLDDLTCSTMQVEITVGPPIGCSGWKIR